MSSLEHRDGTRTGDVLAMDLRVIMDEILPVLRPECCTKVGCYYRSHQLDRLRVSGRDIVRDFG